MQFCFWKKYFEWEEGSECMFYKIKNEIKKEQRIDKTKKGKRKEPRTHSQSTKALWG